MQYVFNLTFRGNKTFLSSLFKYDLMQQKDGFKNL